MYMQVINLKVNFSKNLSLDVIQILARAHEPAVLKSYSWFAATAARELVREDFA